jgi:hypothetical protein
MCRISLLQYVDESTIQQDARLKKRAGERKFRIQIKDLTRRRWVKRIKPSTYLGEPTGHAIPWRSLNVLKHTLHRLHVLKH